jgi:LPS-assembly lipoprotein
MSSCDRRAARRSLALALAAVALASAAGCTVRPLYGSGGGASAFGEPAPRLAELRGRIDVAPVNTRTEQIVRNALLFGFNGGETPLAPFYRVSLSAIGLETVVSIQQGSGVPAASLYRLTVTYQVVRATDGKVVASGSRFANAPFDRSRQLFAATRAIRDAQERAGRDVAEQIRLVALGAIRKDLPTLAASAPLGK